MPSFRRLSDAYLAKCEAAEKAGTLTPRQAADLRGHRGLAGAVQMARDEAVARRELQEEKPEPKYLYCYSRTDGKVHRALVERETEKTLFVRGACGGDCARFVVACGVFCYLSRIASSEVHDGEYSRTFEGAVENARKKLARAHANALVLVEQIDREMASLGAKAWE